MKKGNTEDDSILKYGNMLKYMVFYRIYMFCA